ncbi:serine/threonine-protein kinase Chk1-like isoform X3 [Mobula birostris]|uniref:serine/threonine-protein kinase Chk1-like isoform X3 n=1 Tax=Mobula birostris TaxID=1983395 RepID=UPI003B28542A
MAVPFVQDWDLLQTLGEGAYEPDVGMPEADADGFFQQLIAGVEYLHNNGITHRGIKPGTLLLGDQEQDSQKRDFHGLLSGRNEKT